MRIPAETVEQIRSISNIVEVISDFVSLKKRGSNWTACCPFHAERTPSFAASQSKNIFKCFGCGKGGDSITFVMEIESCSYTEALRYLAQKYHIPIEEKEELTSEELQTEYERESLLAIHKFAQEYYADILQNHPDGKAIGLSYCKERGFLAPAIEKFGLGFALPAWEHFIESAKKKGFSLDILEKSGLITKRDDGKIFDRFRDRFIFPIHSVAGKVIAFGARTLTNDKKVAKYLNSPETLIYHKSNVLYGLFQAKKSIRDTDNCYLVEGYADVISLHQADIQNVVASSGTSLTLEQIRLLRRFTENVTVLYDSDSAGIKASLRGIDLLLEEGMNVYALHLPDGHDPDSYVRKMGAMATQSYLKDHAQDFITFKASLFLEEMSNPIRKAEVIRDIVQSIIKIPDEIKQSVYFQQCAQLFAIDEQILIAEARKIQGKAPKPQEKKALATPHESRYLEEPIVRYLQSEDAEREVIRLLLLYGKEWVEKDLPLMFFFLENIKEITFEHPLYKQIRELMWIAYQQSHILTPEDLLNSSKIELARIAANLTFEPDVISPNWEEKYYVYIVKEREVLPKKVSIVILHLKHDHVEKLIVEVSGHLQEAQDEKDLEKEKECLITVINLEETRKKIADDLGMVVKHGVAAEFFFGKKSKTDK